MIRRIALEPQTLKWAILVVFVLAAGGVVLVTPQAHDPMRPGLLVLMWAMWLKLLLEYLWGLPMRLRWVEIQPRERARRSLGMVCITAAVLWGTWLFLRDN